MDRINKSGASGMANSESTTTPSHLNEGAHNHTQALTGTQSNTTDGASDKNSAGTSAPEPVPSNSSLPLLEAAMKATKISTRSCLKSAKQSPGPDGNAKPTKRASFATDDTLLKCMVTGAHTLPKAHTKERHEDFMSRSFQMADQIQAAKEARRLAREAGIEGSDSDDSDSDDANNTYLLFAAREENRDDDDWDSDGVYDKKLEDRLYEAYVEREQLTMRAISGGAIDFQLYVTRNQELLQDIERLVRDYCVVVQVASYHGDERGYAMNHGYAVTQLPAELYRDYRSAMSGFRWP